MRSLICANLPGIWVTVALLVPCTTSADTLVAPDSVVARADGSFSYMWRFYKGPGSVMVASFGWYGTENVAGGLVADCFCLPEACTFSEGDSLTLKTDGRLTDPTRHGRVSNWVGFCKSSGLGSSTVIRPASTTGVDDSSPGAMLRLWNEPNPFSGKTTFRYLLPESGGARLRIYDLSGRLIATLIDEVQTAGRHSATWDARSAPSLQDAGGVFFARLTFRGRIQSRAVVILR